MLAFLFTDIEGSTNLLRDLGVRYRTLLLDHRSLLKTAFERFGGRLLGSEGDSLFAVFPNPKDALLAAAEGQLSLNEAKWPDGIALKVRMGIHVGAGGPVSFEGLPGAPTAVSAAPSETALRLSCSSHGGRTHPQPAEDLHLVHRT